MGVAADRQVAQMVLRGLRCLQGCLARVLAMHILDNSSSNKVCHPLRNRCLYLYLGGRDTS